MLTTGSALVECEGVRFAYGPIQVLTDLSLSVGQGELFGLLGPNGSGKSTVVRLLSRVLSPCRGIIRFSGKDLREYRREELARQIAVVPQETHVELPFSVLEVVLMGRAPHLKGFGFERARDLAVAYRAMEQTGVRTLAARKIHELSGGERQRVMLARAFAQEPRLLLLDEPTAFLDIKHQVEVYDVVKELCRREGLTVVAALHDINLAALYCDRVGLLRAGRLFCCGTPEEVFTDSNIETVYETEVHVGLNQSTGTIYVLPLAAAHRSRQVQHESVPRLTI
ncbi:MAG: heme ABC transporter ATP-binding protein [Candidatus Binatia bacterium]|nr:heme ABC transporter ATP-binding protein [Candidatus Binatia bacterium]